MCCSLKTWSALARGCERRIWVAPAAANRSSGQQRACAVLRQLLQPLAAAALLAARTWDRGPHPHPFPGAPTCRTLNKQHSPPRTKAGVLTPVGQPEAQGRAKSALPPIMPDLLGLKDQAIQPLVVALQREGADAGRHT